MFVHVPVCVCVCVRACVRACVRVCSIMLIMQINGCTQLCATAQSMLLCLIGLLLHAHALLPAMVSVRLGTLHDIECISLRDIERVSLRGFMRVARLRCAALWWRLLV